ncbi:MULTISPECIES: serine hydrolase domain-containing protein [unclassified Rhizobium]|jgi:CubicO group peptidase (beta-lactamase class C family)|uniref:serine hydrolase domain-containing protein n=2 Tax=Rhizobium TaxID=379 RepID=UPI0006456B32|nr:MULTISPECIES: serine hydrolase domain-containing protein [unclassified Rhizobium]OJY63928.1 MAG: serine hydrolase [Rhizobium sp. 60-20]RKD60925.1 CubicO group peptidase (beta-lactamase class C family) [Rhizobium sp. WW_1]
MSETAHWKAAQECAAQFTQNWSNDEPGGAVIGFDAQGIRFAEAGGVESLSTLAPFTAASVVRYASVTKHAFCALVLEHSDKIGLDDPLGQHLPELQAPLRDVTVGRALDMSGGLPDTRECLSLFGLSVYTETKAGPLLDFLVRQTRLNYDAGTEISYSNTGYRLVEAALERRGVFFRDYVRERGAQAGAVLDAPDVWNDPVIGLVPGYWRDGERWQLSAAGLHISASGSMTGSGESLTKWLIALLEGKGALDGILERLSAPRQLADGRTSGYGLGLRQSLLGNRTFIGHGGSHPGYKSYFLLDPARKTGFVIVSNREDTNGYKIALESMAALTGDDLPRPSSALRDGTYATESGPWWIKVAGSTVTYLDADETVYEDDGPWVSSRSASSPMRLKMEGEDIVGEVGHAQRRFHPVREQEAPASLSGVWNSPEGARFEIENGSVIMGIGPVRHRMPLRALGNGRFLFTLVDGPWTKRVCLNLLEEDRLELVLARARMIEYRRAG